jgi:hypothetical protein
LTSVDLCNNGYLRFANATQIELARANPEIFRVSWEGLIARASFIPEKLPLHQKSSHGFYEDHDYEGAILARQEKYLNY